MEIYSKITKEIKAIGLTNDNIHSYGDGFEKAIELCLYAINELKKQDQALQLLQANVVGRREQLKNFVEGYVKEFEESGATGWEKYDEAKKLLETI
jgi:hypothetical protein